MERESKINKSLDELVNEDKKLSKMMSGGKRKGPIERDERRPANINARVRDRSDSNHKRRGKFKINFTLLP
jgi:hypothetical protein